MNKLYDKITWHNNTTPSLNETNLNVMSKAIDDIDDRVVELAADVMVVVPEIREDMEIISEVLPAAQAAADSAEQAADSAEQAASSEAEIKALIVTDFSVNYSTGELVYSSGFSNFAINTTTGDLEWGITDDLPEESAEDPNDEPPIEEINPDPVTPDG